MKYYLFDFDGTLVDSMPTYVNAMLSILAEENIKYPTDIVKTITPLGIQGTISYFKQLGVSMSADAMLQKIYKYMIDEYTYNIPAKSNVIDVLTILKKSGASLNVLTASPHITLDPCLKRLGIYDIFDNVWSCDDFNTTKADPEIYKMSAEKIGAKANDILFLDDNINADKTAKKAGMKVCGVYDKSSDEYITQMKQLNDYYIYDFSELLNIDF